VNAAVDSPTRELLTWVASRRRTYAETMNAWTSTCPRLAVWDDAVSGRLVEVVRGGSVVLTPQGRALIEGEGEA
jgi:hypothetical protein